MAYKMTHPDSDLTVEARADEVEMYVSQGWEASDKAKAAAEEVNTTK